MSLTKPINAKTKRRFKVHAESNRKLRPVCGGGKKGLSQNAWQVSIVDPDCKSCIRIVKARDAKNKPPEGQQSLI